MRARSGDTAPGPDPLALDPLSPIDVDPGTAAPASPFALDPLSPLGRDAR